MSEFTPTGLLIKQIHVKIIIPAENSGYDYANNDSVLSEWSEIMKKNKSAEIFENAPVHKAVFKNALPAMAAMLMVLIYNLADTFFIGQTHNDFQVAAVSLATPVFLLFMAVGTIFGIGGTSVISRAMGKGWTDYPKK